MSSNRCEFEPQIRKSAASGTLDELLKNHASACEECTETLKVSGWLRNFAESSKPATLPAAGFLLFKARLREKQALARLALNPIFYMKAAALVIGLTTLGFLQFLGGPTSETVTPAFIYFAKIAPFALIVIIFAAAFSLVMSRIIVGKARDQNRTL